jgi:hypothetical protein
MKTKSTLELFQTKVHHDKTNPEVQSLLAGLQDIEKLDRLKAKTKHQAFAWYNPNTSTQSKN